MHVERLVGSTTRGVVEGMFIVRGRGKGSFSPRLSLGFLLIKD